MIQTQGYYDDSITYLSQEMMKQTIPHRKPYVKAIQAMKILNKLNGLNLEKIQEINKNNCLDNIERY